MLTGCDGDCLQAMTSQHEDAQQTIVRMQQLMAESQKKEHAAASHFAQVILLRERESQ